MDGEIDIRKRGEDFEFSFHVGELNQVRSEHGSRGCQAYIIVAVEINVTRVVFIRGGGVGEVDEALRGCYVRRGLGIVIWVEPGTWWS